MRMSCDAVDDSCLGDSPVMATKLDVFHSIDERKRLDRIAKKMATVKKKLCSLIQQLTFLCVLQSGSDDRRK